MGCHSDSGSRACQPRSALGHGTAAGRAGPGVQAAFALLGLLPPPATGTVVLARQDGPGARRAADAGITLVVQAVERQIARPDVRPDLLLGPVQQRTQLVQPVLGVPLDGLALGARLGLLPAHACNPRGVAGDEFLERHDFAHIAAGTARRGAVEEAVDAL